MSNTATLASVKGNQSQDQDREHQVEDLENQEHEGKAEALRQISTLNAEIQQWKTRFESKGVRLEEIEEAKRKLQQRVQDLQDANEAANTKVASLENTRDKLMGDLNDAQVDAERREHELQKIVHRFEVEKKEIQHALDKAEAALEAKESEVFRAQVEIRSGIEKRIQVKEEEFENTRKNQQRALDSMQAKLEEESMGKQEALHIKKELESDNNELKERIVKEEGNRKELKTQVAKLVEEKIAPFLAREKENVELAESEKRANKLQVQKNDLDRQLNDLTDRLGEMEGHNADLQRVRKENEQDVEGLKKNVQDLEMSLRKAKSEKQERDANIRSLQDEMANQDETVAKLNEDKKGVPPSKCAVCGEGTSARHYGVVCCTGCGNFWSKWWWKEFDCVGTLDCPVTPTIRKNCQFCRLRKCREAGMTKPRTKTVS